MLWTILATLVILWLLGFVGGLGKDIHLLLVVAVVVFALQLISRRRSRYGL
ncbi:MAG: lmo0937 family membrane protein [Blastocatellia bacterium]|nr:lmo0937 family membrane protein [Blastocatellia bacterium]